MNKQITIDLIEKFKKHYQDDPTNLVIEHAITENGIAKSCLNKKIIQENPPIFNIELPDSYRYRQKENSRCWIYSGFNTIQYHMAKNLNIDVRHFALSNNYIAFFDKLEKSNNTYENTLHTLDTKWEDIDIQAWLPLGVNEGGYWSWFVSIVNKYGLMPYEQMPDVYESLSSQNITALYAEKVKKDCLKLRTGYENHLSMSDLRNMKEQFLQENYTLLSKILGEPKAKFDYEYRDLDGKYITFENLTPLAFKNNFLTLNLDNFISLGNMPMYNKEYNKIYRKKYIGNVYENSDVLFLNLPIQEIKKLAIKQLKDQIPVYLLLHLRKFNDKKSGVLDTRLFDYKNTFGFNMLTKEEALNTHDIRPHHCMTLCGVHLSKEGIPKRWKVEDSYGTEEKVNGYYIMNDNFFDAFVMNVIIHKKYLSNKQLDLLKQDAIELETRDPF